MIYLEFITIMATGLLAGALLTEACILVPYWQKMPAKTFLRLHHKMAPSLFRYFAPLTVIGTLLPIITFILVYSASETSWPAWLLSATCAVCLLSFYLLFFRQANNRFSTTTDPEIAAKTLAAWAKVHMIRTFIAIVGFSAAIWGGMPI